MGGRAIKNSRRISADEFTQLSQEISNILNYHFYNEITISYRNKPDFGDCDLLCLKPLPEPEELRDLLYDLGSKEVHNNNGTWSFEWKQFQVDLISVSDAKWHMAKVYFSYNDLNNFIGRISRKIGFKFGFDGVYYNFRENNQRWPILITRDPAKAYELFDYDFSQWEKGFDELEDIFQFVTTSKYFDPEVFKWENLDHTNRTRNKKRKNYSLFLDWLKDKEFPKKNLREINAIDLVYQHFPDSNLNDKIRNIRMNIERNKKVSEKFNGNIIMDIIPLKGRELGNFIGKIKSSKKEFDQWVIDTNENQIREYILEYYDKSSQ